MHRYSFIITCLRHNVSATTTPSIRAFSTSGSRKIKINLNQQQQDVLEAISQGKSVFITGAAGTGKSHLLTEAIKLLRKKHSPSQIYVTASTGVAASAINGQTLHSFSGIDEGCVDHEVMLQRVVRNKPAFNRWQKAQVLVIDEVSMLSGVFFDKLELLARNIRSADTDEVAVWGGIQIVAGGDFLQLPPIKVDVEGFAFQAECWSKSFDLQVELYENFRQQSDPQLMDLLQGIRSGELDESHIQILQECTNKPIESSLTVPHIYPKNEDVNRVNEEMFKSLDGRDVKTYLAKDTKKFVRKGIVPDKLELKKGARVMLIKNLYLRKGLVNGSIGTVDDFAWCKSKKVKGMSGSGMLPIVKFESGITVVMEPEKWETMNGDKKVGTRKQIPLILAWAISIHKCQGMSLDRLHTDLSSCFEYGMGYVALSRVRSLEGLYLSGFDPSKIKAHPKVVEFYKTLSGPRQLA